LGMGNNPVSMIDPDGGCTDCPEDASPGDTFNHPEYGLMVYDDFLGWTSALDGTSYLDTVFIGGSDVSDVNINLSFIPEFYLYQTEVIKPINKDLSDISMLVGVAKNYYINNEGLVRGKSGRYYTFLGRKGFNQNTGRRALMRSNYIKGKSLGYLSKGMGIYQYENIYNEFYPDNQRSTVGNDIAFAIEAGSNTITTFAKNPVSFVYYLGYDVLGKQGLGKLKWYNETFLPWGRKLIGTE